MGSWGRLIPLLLGWFLSSCGGGGGGGSKAISPTISNLKYSPTATYVDTGGGQTSVTGTFTVGGANDGVASVTLAVLDGAGRTISSTTTPVPNGSGFTSGQLQGSVTAATGTAGNYSIHVTLTDLAGLTSNALSGSFRVSNQPWQQKAAMPQTRESFVVATLGGLAYVVGGQVLGTGVTPGPASPRVDVYDPAADLWTLAAAMPTARVAPAAAVFGGLLYVFGGSSSSGGAAVLSTVEAFDPMTGAWTSKAPMPTPRYGAAAAVVGARICLFGGNTGGEDVSTTECYDPVAQVWSPTLSPMPTFRSGLSAQANGNAGYAIGGYSGGNRFGGGPGYVAVVERYDGVADTWSVSEPMSAPRSWAASAVTAGSLFVFGGDNVNRGTAVVEAYDFQSGAWAAKTAMPVALVRIGAASIGGAVYVFEASNTLKYTPSDDIL
jgi:N-acetylneuraminic acid mutarotase